MFRESKSSWKDVYKGNQEKPLKDSLGWIDFALYTVSKIEMNWRWTSKETKMRVYRVAIWDQQPSS